MFNKWKKVNLDELTPVLSNSGFRRYSDSSSQVWQNVVTGRYRITVNGNLDDVFIDDLETLEEVAEYLEN